VTRLLNAELLKLRTTKTPWVLALTTIALSGLAVASTVVVGSGTDFDLESVSGARDVLSTAVAGGIVVLVLGIIITAGEYRHGTSVETFLTTPQRWKVIVAKLVTATMAGGVVGSLASAVALLATLVTYRSNGLVFPLDAAQASSTLGAAVLYAALFAAMGAATGSLIRNQVAAIAGWLSWIAVVEHIAEGFFPTVGRWLPVGAGRALVSGGATDLLAPAMAAVVLCAYAAAIMGAAIGTERLRDA